MKYLSKTFSVPAAPPAITEEEWEAIWKPKCAGCGTPLSEEQICERCRIEEWRLEEPDLGDLK